MHFQQRASVGLLFPGLMGCFWFNENKSTLIPLVTWVDYDLGVVLEYQFGFSSHRVSWLGSHTRADAIHGTFVLGY